MKILNIIDSLYDSMQIEIYLDCSKRDDINS